MSIHRFSTETVLDLATSMGCEVTEQKSFFKITGPTPKKALYVGKAKRFVTRIDISGFEPEEHSSIVQVSKEDAKTLKLGAVRGQILPKTLGEDVDPLEGLRVAIRGLLSETEGFKLGKKPVETEEVETETEEVEATA